MSHSRDQANPARKSGESYTATGARIAGQGS